MSAVREDILRVKGELKQVHEHRTAAVDLRLPAYASAAEDLYGKLALSRFALHKPEMYFHRPTASAVLSTLNAYASEDFPRLTGILKDCRPKLDAAFDHLVAVNKEDDDGQWPRDEVDRLRLIAGRGVAGLESESVHDLPASITPGANRPLPSSGPPAGDCFAAPVPCGVPTRGGRRG